MVPDLHAALPKDRPATMLATVKIDSTGASCPAGFDHRFVSQPSNNIFDDQSTLPKLLSLPELSGFNDDDFLNTIDRLHDSLNECNGGLNSEQFMNLAEVSHVCPLRDTCLTGYQLQDTHDNQCKAVLIRAEPPYGLDIEDAQKPEDMDGNNTQVEAAVSMSSETAQNARRKRSFDLADPTLASMFYPGYAWLEPLAKKVRIVESGSTAYLEWFSSMDTSVQHLAASDMLEVLKLPKDNAFASWVAFNTEKSTDKKEGRMSNCSEEITARLVGYDYELSPRRNSESPDYDMYWMSSSDDYLSSAPPSGKLCSLSQGRVGVLGDDGPYGELLKSLDLLPVTMSPSSQIRSETMKLLSGELVEDCTGCLPEKSEKQMENWFGIEEELEEDCIEDLLQLAGELTENEMGDLQLSRWEKILPQWKLSPVELLELDPEELCKFLPDELPEWNFESWLHPLDKSCSKLNQKPAGELIASTAENWHQRLSKSSGSTEKTYKPTGRPRGRPRKAQTPSGKPRGRPKKTTGKLCGRMPKKGQEEFGRLCVEMVTFTVFASSFLLGFLSKYFFMELSMSLFLF